MTAMALPRTSTSSLRSERSRTLRSLPSSSSITLVLSDDVGQDAPQDLLQPQDLLPHAPPTDADNLIIAPWLAPGSGVDSEPPTPPPKPQRFGFPTKPSFNSFSIPRQPSSSTISVSPSRYHDSLSVHSAENVQSSDSRRSKSSLSILTSIMKKRSRSRLRSDVRLPEEPMPPLPPSPPPVSSRKDKSRPKKKASSITVPISEPHFELDTNLESMDGIVDFSVLPSAQDGSSPGTASGFESSHQSSSSVSSIYNVRASPSNMFSNPFLPSAQRTLAPSTLAYDARKISPKTPASAYQADNTASPSWTAPESWAVEKEGEDPLVPEYSSSEESASGTGHRLSRKRRKTVASTPNGVSPVLSTSKPPRYKIRIYRASGSYHVVSIDFNVTVAELTPQLKKKLLLDVDRESHRLYLKERGRERVLAPTERPASIVRRRLEQAGYEPADGLELLGADDTQFLLKFVYKSNALGPAEEDLNIDTFDLIDLTGRSLRTVPILFYPHADAIVSLNLSRNPMLEIPLDFIQSCTTLRELRLQHMAMKKVPQSVRHCRTLHRLDLSCNRIVDLDDAGLDSIPQLRSLKVQNNKLQKLPPYFRSLRALKDLNISNNYFSFFPAVAIELTSLVDLDISFNSIRELPDGIGRLHALERLIIVGNEVSKFPEDCYNLTSLRMLDCRRNHIADLSVVSMLPKVEQIVAGHNAAHALDLSFGPLLQQLDASHNDITQLSLLPGRLALPFALTSLDISYAKLSALDEVALSQLTALRTLRIDHNTLRSIPDTLGSLSMLIHLSCSNNQLLALPSTIGRLQKLETLEAHNNSLSELPASTWSCASLHLINVTSNFIDKWRLPPIHAIHTSTGSSSPSPECLTLSLPGDATERNGLLSSSSPPRTLPPLVYSLEKLYLGENRLTDDTLHPLALLKELRVLNLSFNEIQDMPSAFFRNLVHLKELYLSGNGLSAIPTEDLHRLTKLEVLFLNGNKLQTLPKELGKIPNLSGLDVGSNILKYNVFNWQFDWNWNFNQNLRYLNLSGNKRLEIRPDMNKQPMQDTHGRKILADFSSLSQLRILGLMDVTATFGTNIPDENADRRIRTSLSEVNGMGYGIADTLGMTEHLNMLDLVQPHFHDKNDEAVFAMFGRASHVANNHALNKELHDHLLDTLAGELERLSRQRGEGIPDALRRTFLKLNKKAHDELVKKAHEEMYTNLPNRKMSNVSASTVNPPMHEMSSIRGGASGVMLYFVGKTLWAANIGDALAVISRQGVAELISHKHDPFERSETTRIRAAEGWVAPKGFVNDEVEVARSFGFYNMLPVVNARPHVCSWQLTDMDEFVIVGNSGLWDVVSYQTAVDIARSARAEPMIAAQKLRDFAISYGAEGTTMIMVISVADLFTQGLRSRQPTMESVIDAETFMSLKRRKRDEISNIVTGRLDDEVAPPTGHLALVFTDIRNSTHLWEVNAGMATAMVLHNNLLRRQLRFCGGYEVKTEGDAFMCSFPTTLSALWWALSVQVQLLHVDWPLEILECEDGKENFDPSGKLIARGLSVRMGIHCGQPVCEPDPITHRMDYFGPIVNRSARISGNAAGGQIMCSADVVREINARVLETDIETGQSHLQPQHAIEAIRQLGVMIVPVGEVKLKGLEVPEMLSLVYPTQLSGRQGLSDTHSDSSSSASRVQFSVEQMRELAMFCVRLETLSTGRVFRTLPERKGSTAELHGRPISQSDSPTVLYGDPKVLLPAMDNASDAELLLVLDSLTTRVENALNTMALDRFVKAQGLQQLSGLQPVVLQSLLSVLSPLASYL